MKAGLIARETLTQSAIQLTLLIVTIVTFGIGGLVALVVVSLVTKPKPEESLRGLVWGLTRTEEREVNADPRDRLWWRSPHLLGGVAIVLLIVLNIIFI